MLHLDHLAIIVSKLEHIAFYEKLGFREKDRFIRPHDTVVLMEQDGITLQIFVDPAHPARVTYPEALGLRHVAFTADDFEKTISMFDCEPVRESFYGDRFTFTKDPDGLPIEIRERSKIE